ncbi:MAG: OB-fold domain-containing protein [Burkholderiaceae bacterium]|nr:OB-fold domain-containing protein [Burkholderiaceae bacterium]MDO9090820.1 OB-fold domain-containing protein [Burkholderiaceae bacterium]
MPERTLPRVLDTHAQAWWDGLRKHRLLLQHCADCGHPRMPPGPICPECWSDKHEWRAHVGTGTVTSFVWYMQPLDPRFTEVPYNVSLVALDGGPVVVSNVLDVAFGALKIGDRVRARFCDEPAGFTSLMFVQENA